ncbi:MAG: TetR/AcrR family transcriptional regulator [Nocardiopsaceae bacterium]|nr:TetR/AcrR family transcriptional regulator [Nocardiopsaceae bacterium]
MAAGPETVGPGSNRARIVAAAYNAVARTGLAGLRVRSVAGEAGVTHATLLYYFKSRSALLNAVVDHAVYDRIAVPLVEDAEPMPAADELSALLHGLSREAEEDPRQPAVLLEILQRGQEHGSEAAMDRYFRTWQQYTTDLLRRGTLEGGFRSDLDPEVTARIIVQFSLGLQTRSPITAEQRGEAIEQLLAFLAPMRP